VTAIDLRWPDGPSEQLYAELHRVVHAVAAGQGAVGWLNPPSEEETCRWVDSILVDVAADDAALCVASVGGVVQGTGAWKRDPAAVFPHRAEVNKIMVHPDARGLGLSRMITQAVVDHDVASGLETLDLGVRGNNHLVRFDEVRMHKKLAKPAGVVWRGSEPGGPGSSPAPRRPAAGH
jgi:ribosomal protein S18 acetylase RimI-like enzyme